MKIPLFNFDPRIEILQSSLNSTIYSHSIGIALLQQSPVIIESIPDQIKKLAEIRDSGILSEQEFTTKKTELFK